MADNSLQKSDQKTVHFFNWPIIGLSFI